MAITRAVYTVLLGGYEELGEQPVAASSELPFICFTDDPDLRSESWEVRHFEPLLPFDLTRSQRELKIRGHESLADFDETLYIDNSVLLTSPPERILDEWLDGAVIASPWHSFRERIIDEFDEVVALGYDDAGRVQEQLIHYAELHPEVLLQRPHWNGMIARKNVSEVTAAMRRWYDHVLRYSRRDQLSSDVALHEAGLEIRSIDLDNNLSEHHRWPVDVGRRAAMSTIGRHRSGPMLAEIARLEKALAGRVAELEETRNALVEERAERAAAAAAEVAAAVEIERRHAEQQLHGILDEVHRSLSWRLTAPVRALGGRRGDGSADPSESENHH